MGQLNKYLKSEMKRYSEYRDNGIIWFPKLPVHWEIKKIKHFSKTLLGGTPSTANIEYWKNGSIPWLPSGMIKNDIIGNPEKFITEKGLKESATKLIKENTVLVAITGATCANIGYLKYQSTANQSVVAIQENKDIINTKYLYYGLLSQRMQILIYKSGGAQAGVNDNDINNIKIPVPPKKEQTAIASFLDHKTQQIDDLIAKKQRLIELLKEERTAMINQAVTKGLDPNVPMKDSGIEWLGEIPKDWEIAKIRRYCQVKRGASPRPIDDSKYFDDKGEFAWVRIADVSASEKYLFKTTQTLSELGSSLSVKKYPDELFLSIAGTVGKPIITKIKCCIHDGFVYFDNLKLNHEFLYYIFYSGRPYLGLGKWGTQLNLNTDTVADIYISVPSKEEQEKIVTYIDQELDKLDCILNQYEEQISILNEYKTSLINSAVTGKIDVRDYHIENITA